MASMPFEESDAVLLRAERYGGYGLGQNGGGARCGNIDGYQLKGIGANPLTTNNRRTPHSYGGLNAEEAVYETIIAQVLERILPVGVATVYGVLLTAEDGAYYIDPDWTCASSWRRGWGAIMVRETCLRPGHFLRAPNFDTRGSDRALLSRDAARVRDINKALGKKFRRVEDLIQRLGGFLRQCARQFAFSQVHRIGHSTVSPSNLSFDGRWIDLTLCGFRAGGANVFGFPPVYEEPAMVHRIISEFIDTFAKYNRLELNPAPLIGFYEKELQSHFGEYMRALFGLGPRVSAGIPRTEEYLLLEQQTWSVLHSGNSIVDSNRVPIALPADDPLVHFQEGLFLSLVNPQRAIQILLGLKGQVGRFMPERSMRAFVEVFRTAHRVTDPRLADFSRFAQLCAIDALKCTLYAEFLFRGRVISRITTLLESDPILCRALIDDVTAVMEWVFGRVAGGMSHLFCGEHVSVTYDACAGEFMLEDKRSGSRHTYGAPSGVMRAIRGFRASDFVIQGYDFSRPLERILSLLMQLTECDPGTARTTSYSSAYVTGPT